ncbi:MAG: porin family protein [Bacteroidota bacterium]|nr:porin family protein [Bacteroidota bacterium]
MKKLIILIIFAVFALSSRAQGNIEVGLKAGLNSSKILMNLSDYTPQTVNNFQFGAFARFNLNRFYIQPEAYFNSKGGEYIDKISPATINSFDLKTIDVPALVGFKVIDKKAYNLHVLAGPVFSLVTSKSVSSQLTETAIKNSFFGWQYGVGADFLFITLDARMESLSSNLYATPNFDSKNGTFVISLGFKIL